MNEHDDDALSAREAAVRERIRNLPPVAADPAFREKLHERFVSGRLVPSARAQRGGRRTPYWVRWAAIPAAAAAVVALVFFLNRDAGWSIQPMSERGAIRVAGQPVDASVRGALARRLKPGVAVETGDDGHVELLADGVLLVEVMPASALTVPNARRSAGHDALAFGVTRGEVRLMTGPRFAGSDLEVTTPEGTVRITGTTVAIDRDDNGTCVCVMHGTAMVGTRAGDMEPVPSGMRKVMPAGGAHAYITRIEPTHLAGLEDFEARHPEMHEGE